MARYEIQKVEHPKLAGIPGGQKWAVVKMQRHGPEVVDSFPLKREAQEYIDEHTECLGHEPDPESGVMGIEVFCDGTCRI